MCIKHEHTSNSTNPMSFDINKKKDQFSYNRVFLFYHTNFSHLDSFHSHHIEVVQKESGSTELLLNPVYKNKIIIIIIIIKS